MNEFEVCLQYERVKRSLERREIDVTFEGLIHMPWVSFNGVSRGFSSMSELVEFDRRMDEAMRAVFDDERMVCPWKA